MCGIAAIFAYGDGAAPVDERELTALRTHMAPRGPDGEGQWISGRHHIGLAHRRLAIIDLSASGVQPMVLSDKDGNENDADALRITFNGEIYNYKELRRELEAKGETFTTNSDTEVLLRLYRRYGAGMVHHLRGMFAFALWDGKREGLLLARDPFGIKPLYYSLAHGACRAASQVKALIAGQNAASPPGAIDLSPNPAGIVGFYTWGYVPEPHTLYKGIKALPAGSTMWIDGKGPRLPEPFFDVAAELAQMPAEISKAERIETVAQELRRSIAHHMVADVPVGVFLSAGRDSATITALATEAAGGASDLHALTLGFEEYRGKPEDETLLATEIARQYDCRHHTHFVQRADFEADTSALLEAMDQPTIDGVNTYFVAKAAAQAGMKVALSGLGGDELFGGYPSFRQIPTLVGLLSPLRPISRLLGTPLRHLTAPVLSCLTSPKYASLFEYGGKISDAYLLRRGLFMPWELSSFLDPDLVREGQEALETRTHLAETAAGPGHSHGKIAALEMVFYMRNQLLRDADWAGMAHGVEIRTPLVDVELFRALAPLIAGRNPPDKRDMAASASPPLPDNILHRPKTGFCVPVHDWLLAASSEDPAHGERGLRGWARRIMTAQKGLSL
ncbi:MAG: asparagine synthase (glutamine-hydrolyzing) [Rhodospirillaceae bacterium]|nr:asparagine synthase (glutamine-hydrolyzing) [Rhodospirillaceae bacterium]